MITPQRTHALACRERTFGPLMTLLILSAFLTVVPLNSAHTLRCLPQPDYIEFEAQIDEVWLSDAFDCLVVQHEIQASEYGGSVWIVTDVANACGEEVWVSSDSHALYEVVPDGELVTAAVE